MFAFEAMTIHPPVVKYWRVTDAPVPVKVMVVKPLVVVGVMMPVPVPLPRETWVMVLIWPFVPFASVRAWAMPVEVNAVDAVATDMAPAPLRVSGVVMRFPLAVILPT